MPSSALSVSDCRARRARLAPERESNSQFLAPPDGSSEQEIRDVRAGDEQDRRDRKKQHPGGQARVLHLAVPQRADAQRNFLAEPGRHGGQHDSLEERL